MPSKTVTTRRRGRPVGYRAPNPQNVRRVAYFTEITSRRLNAWMHQEGVALDTEALAIIVGKHLDAAGIEDPGPDSDKGKPPYSPKRKTATVAAVNFRGDTRGEQPVQLALTG